MPCRNVMLMLLRTSHPSPYGNNSHLSPSPVVSSTSIFFYFVFLGERRVPPFRERRAPQPYLAAYFFDLTYTVSYQRRPNKNVDARHRRVRSTGVFTREKQTKKDQEKNHLCFSFFFC